MSGAPAAASWEIRPLAADADVLALLRDAGLPVADLTGRRGLVLLGQRDRERLLGVVGLEIHGAPALLRSLAVAPAARGRGLGHALVTRAEAEARAAGATAVYLLTQTAAPFFERLGYARIERSAAPEAIRATAQFASLCPDSAVLMRREALTGG